MGKQIYKLTHKIHFPLCEFWSTPEYLFVQISVFAQKKNVLYVLLCARLNYYIVIYILGFLSYPFPSHSFFPFFLSFPPSLPSQFPFFYHSLRTELRISRESGAVESSAVCWASCSKCWTALWNDRGEAMARSPCWWLTLLLSGISGACCGRCSENVDERWKLSLGWT